MLHLQAASPSNAPGIPNMWCRYVYLSKILHAMGPFVTHVGVFDEFCGYVDVLFQFGFSKYTTTQLADVRRYF